MAEPMYVVISGGDGYTAHIVPASKLDAVVLALECGSDEPVSDAQRHLVLDHLHDEDHWESSHPVGPVRYRADFEDGYLEIIKLTEPLTVMP